MTKPQRGVPAAGQPRAAAAGAPEHAPALVVADQLAPRIRLPADLLRCVIACMEIALLAGLGLLATATAIGVEYDVGHVSRRVPAALLGFIGFVAHIALLVLPVVLAVRLIVRRQPRRLAEAAATGLATAAVVAGINLLLRHPAVVQMYQALAPSGAGPHATPLDGYLAALAAYVTVIGLSGSQRLRTAFWLTIGFYALASVANDHANILSVLIALLIGSAIGSGLRYAFGSVSERPSAGDIAVALSPAAGMPVTQISRIRDDNTDTRRYSAVTSDGTRLDITVFDRDQQAADVAYRLYRRIRLKSQVSRIVPFTVQRAAEHRALLSYAAERAGVRTPQLRALVRVGPEAVVLAYEHYQGVTLAQRNSELTDAELHRVWETVLALHAHRVTHRGLTADHILLLPGNGRRHRGTADGNSHAPAGPVPGGAVSGGPVPGGTGPARPGAGAVMLLEPGSGDVAASDLQLRLDISQLLAELALLVGPDRAASSAQARIGADELAAVVPLLQAVALHRSTRTALRQHKDVLPALRKQLQAPVSEGEVAPAQLVRIRPRTLISLVAVVVAVYILVGQFDRVKLGGLLKHADWRWTAVALVLSGVSYLGAAWSLSGFVLERLSLTRTLLAQLAASFVTLVTPAAVGGVALNLRYLRRAHVAPADAAASVGVSQVIAFGLHAILLITFAALAGSSRGHSLRPPVWVYIAVAAVIAAALVITAFPRGRRMVRSRLAPALSQVIPRLLDIAQRPVKLTEGIGGAALLTAAYILCLAASVRALGGSVSIVSIAVVYLTGSALGSAVPTPGGLGAVEAALTAGLTAAGLPGITAVSAVLLFRTLTFWLPVPLGWAALTYLQRREAL